MSASKEQLANKRRLRESVAHANEQAGRDLAAIFPLLHHLLARPLYAELERVKADLSTLKAA